MDRAKNQSYPGVITALPEAQMPFAGCQAWILQSTGHQLVFFDFEAGLDLPDHKHTYPQWGIVVDGIMELRVDGKPKLCRKGDEYLIPAGSMHGAKFIERTRVIDLFSEPNRYKPKQV